MGCVEWEKKKKEWEINVHDRHFYKQHLPENALFWNKKYSDGEMLD